MANGQSGLLVPRPAVPRYNRLFLLPTFPTSLHFVFLVFVSIVQCCSSGKMPGLLRRSSTGQIEGSAQRLTHKLAFWKQFWFLAFYYIFGLVCIAVVREDIVGASIQDHSTPGCRSLFRFCFFFAFLLFYCKESIIYAIVYWIWRIRQKFNDFLFNMGVGPWRLESWPFFWLLSVSESINFMGSCLSIAITTNKKKSI